MHTERLTLNSKRRKNPPCPYCKSKNVAYILHGLPIETAELKDDLEHGRVILGGCNVFTEDGKEPNRYHCNDCGKGF